MIDKVRVLLGINKIEKYEYNLKIIRINNWDFIYYRRISWKDYNLGNV